MDNSIFAEDIPMLIAHKEFILNLENQGYEYVVWIAKILYEGTKFLTKKGLI